MKEMGMEAYHDGRRKSFFYLAVNLLDLEDLKTVMEHLARQHKEVQLFESNVLTYIQFER